MKPANIRHTHFSRNPKIAQFLKAYHYVKEFGEGIDRIYRELEANGTPVLSFNSDDFILRVTVNRSEVAEKVAENSSKVAEKEAENELKRTENHQKLPEKSNKLPEKLPEKIRRLTEKLTERASRNGEKLTENKLKILRLMIEDPYISKADIAKIVGISYTAVGSNIKNMRGKYIRRVGPDKGGFWEIIE